MAVGDPTMSLNTRTGRYRIVLENGEPIFSDRPDYPALSMLFEDPGWPMEQTQRRGSILKEFPESTSNTPTLFKSAVESRLDPLVQSQDIVFARCTDIKLLRRPDGTAITGNIEYQQPGRPAAPLPFEVTT